LTADVFSAALSQQQVSPQQAGVQQQASRHAAPQQQVFPQQQSVTFAAFVFMAAAPPIRVVRTNAPTAYNIPRRFMCPLHFRDPEINRPHNAGGALPLP
jgi:hypothetical protein